MSEPLEKNNSFWLDTLYAKELTELELELVTKYLKSFFGLHILQIGQPSINYITDSCRINHRMVLSNDINFKPDDERSVVYSEDYFIPLETDSIDAVILAHDLEFSKDPRAALREVDRILLPEGHLIILGFNPWSFWGLRSLLTSSGSKSLDQFPWDGHWFSCHRVCDWLSLLNYEIEARDYKYFKPCINNQKILNSVSFFDKIGKFIPLGAASYAIVAKKKRVAMTTLKARWEKNIEFVAANNYAEPSMRIKNGSMKIR